jgi:hypothetical protein
VGAAHLAAPPFVFKNRRAFHLKNAPFLFAVFSLFAAASAGQTFNLLWKDACPGFVNFAL